MATTIDWGNQIINVPRADMTLVQSVPTEIRSLSLDAFRRDLKNLEDGTTGISYPDTHRHNTTVSVGGVDLARVIEIINGYTVTFEDGSYAVNLSGANSNVGDVVNVNNVSVRSSNSAGLVTSAAIEFGEYGGGVTFDPINGVSGTAYPNGTQRQPSSNLADVNTILQVRGFKRVFIKGDVTIGTQDFSDGITFEGQNSSVASVTLLDPTNVNNCEFKNLFVSGVADNSNVFRDCALGVVSSLDAYLDRCGLSETISLGGVSQTTMVDCYSLVAGTNTPTISIGTGSALAIRGYKGGMELTNKTGTDQVSIDLTSGQVVIGPGNTTGEIILRGSGEYSGSSDGTYIVDQMLHGSKVDSIRQIVELQRPHHTGMGRILYWDPYNGDDTHAGDHLDRGTKTFAQAHFLATDNGHDIIIGVTGSPSGVTVTNENIVISKNYLFLRSTGRDFQIISADDSLPAIEITGNGVEVSSLLAGTSTSNTTEAIHSSGSFPYIKDVYIENSSSGIHITGGEHGIIENTRVSHGTGHGIKLDGASEHFVITDSHVGSNAGGGVIINYSTGHEVTIKDTVIHGNTGYGVDISATSSGVLIDSSVTMYSNSLGDVNDLGTGTVNNAGGSGLTVAQDARLQELHLLQGLDINNPMTVTTTTRDAGSLSLAITGDGTTTSTVTRNP